MSFSLRSSKLLLLCILLFVSMIIVEPQPVVAAHTGPWDVANLQQTPTITWGTQVDHGTYTVRPLYYSNENYLGNSTRVFAYYSAPKNVTGTIPAMVLVHGGGGKAYNNWAAQWAQYGYAAISMDLFGNGPSGTHMTDGGPNLTDATAFTNISASNLTNMWSYQAVAAVIRAVSVVKSQPIVDPTKIGMMGISWGGYLTEIVSGLDNRLNFSMPVYGSGFYLENSREEDKLLNMTRTNQDLWVQNFDPKQYLPQANIPMFFATGTTDFFFPLDSWKKSHRLTPGNKTLRLFPNWAHNNSTPWSTPEFKAFADQQVKGGITLPIVTGQGITGASAWASFTSSTAITNATLHYTTDFGDYQARSWQSTAASIDSVNSIVSATVPTGATAYYFNIKDNRNFSVSSSYEEFIASHRIEAEDYNAGGQNVGYYDTSSGNEGGAYRNEDVDINGTDVNYSNNYVIGSTQAGEWTAYDVYLPSDQAYIFGFNVGTIDSSSTISIYIDGVSQGTLNLPNTGSLEAFQTVRFDAINVTEGKHTIKLVYGGSSFAFDYYDYNSKRIEAEDFARGGQGIAYHDTTSGNAGGDYRLDAQNRVDIYSVSAASNYHAIGSTATGEYLVYDVYFPSSGTGSLTFRVGTQNTTSKISVYLDGTFISMATLPNTGGYANYQSVSLPGIAVTSGMHTVKLVLTGNFAFDYFDIAPTTEPTPTPTPTGNLALNKTVNAYYINNSTAALQPSDALSYAVDGDINTRTQASGQWRWKLRVDLGASTSIDRVIVTMPSNRYATAFDIQTSTNGTTYTTVKSVTGFGGGTSDNAITATNARYIMIVANKPDGAGQTGSQMGISELEVYAPTTTP